MSVSQSGTPNGLLAALSADDFALLQPCLERVELARRETLIEADTPIEHVYFLESGVGSIVSDFPDGAVEIGIFGYEGMSGTAVLLGTDQTPYRSFMQVDGRTALRIGVEDLRQAWRQSETLQILLLRYAQAFSVQSTQTAAANAKFDLPKRLARWLLMCHDRLEGDDIALTHEFMSMMLGVRRAGVTDGLHALEGVRAIRARRGVVTIINRASLEKLAGLCYGRAEAEYRRLIGPFGKPELAATGVPEAFSNGAIPPR